MAKLYVTEFSAQHTDQGRPVPVAYCPLITNNNVAITGGSVQSAVFSKNTNIIRVHSDAICSIKIGLNPTATTDDARFAQNQTEYFGFEAGQGFQIAVIQNV